MLAIIPAFQPDQSIESVVMLAGLHNGLQSPRDAKHAIFGSRSIRIGGLLSSGLRACFDSLKGAGYATFRDFVEHHGYVALFKPFIPAETYDRALQKLESDNNSGTLSMLSIGSTQPICASFKFCAECARRELQTLGYAYAHRTHQIIGIDTCPEHMVTLGMPPGKFNSVAASQGLLIFSVDADDLVNIGNPQFGPPDLSTNSTERNFGAWVRAAFAGELPASEERHRVDTIRARLNALPRKPGESNSDASRLKRMVLEAYGHDYLEQLGFPMKPGPTEHWPALYFLGRVYVRNTFASLLILNALFESPTTYANALERQRDILDTETLPDFKSRGNMKLVWGIGLIKDFLRNPSLLAIARKHNTDFISIREQLRAHPMLPARRKRSLRRIKLRQARRIALGYLEGRASGSRSGLIRCNYNAYQYLKRHDKAWLDECFPRERRSDSPPPLHNTQRSPSAGSTPQSSLLVAVAVGTPIYEPAE